MLLVDALRSGKFQQGRGALRSAHNNYCCLGVACEVYRQHTVNGGEWIPPTYSDIPLDAKVDGDGDPVYMFIDQSGVLPDVVRQWYGFTNVNPRLCTESGGRTAATIWNDSDRIPFPAIADAFERTYFNDKTA